MSPRAQLEWNAGRSCPQENAALFRRTHPGVTIESKLFHGPVIDYDLSPEAVVRTERGHQQTSANLECPSLPEGANWCARTNTADAEAPSLRLYRGLEAVARARAVYKSDQRGMAELAEYDEVEPDMEHDPTLASCCRREIKDRRIKQSKLDHIRSGMPATVRPCTALGYCPRARSSSRRILSSVQCMPRLSSSTYLSQLVDKSLITSICAKGAESPPLTASTPRRTCCAPGLLGACSITRGGRKMLSAYTPSTTWPSALRRKLHCRQTCRAWRHDRGRDRCSSQRRAGSRVSATSPHAPPAAPVPHSALSALPFLL